MHYKQNAEKGCRSLRDQTENVRLKYQIDRDKELEGLKQQMISLCFCPLFIWLNITEIYCLTDLGAGAQKSRHQQGLALSKDDGNPSWPHLASGILLSIFSVSWFEAASSQSLPRSSPGILPVSLSSYKDTSHIVLGATFYDLLLLWPHLNLTNCIYNNPISKSGHKLIYWGLGLQLIFFGDTFQPMTSFDSFFSKHWTYRLPFMAWNNASEK